MCVVSQESFVGNESWFLLSLEGYAMKQINTYALYELSTQLQGLRGLPAVAAQFSKDEAYQLFFARYWLQNFFIDKPVMPMEVSADAAKELVDSITEVMNKLFADPPTEVYDYEVANIRTKLANLETVMSLELQRHQTYLVSQIGGYSMSLLTTKAEVNILEDALAIIGEQAKKDFREAGRCLAFEVPTAAGFHAMRATEHVLRQYHALLTGKDVSRIDWAVCVSDLKEAGADPKVLQVLDQIRSLHRNPLMHPQEFLSMKDAIGLFDIAKSAIGALAEEISTLRKDEEEKRKSNSLFAAVPTALLASSN